jgi:G3E family GTPase
MLLESNADRAWRPGETRFNRLVFIGRNLDREALVTGFRPQEGPADGPVDPGDPVVFL